MSESENIPPAKVPRLAHVTLTQSSDLAKDLSRSIVVGYRVREDIAEKSGLLSGLAQVDGLASLPDDISPEDVQLWQLCSLRDTIPSISELVTVVKVADALGGDDQAAWEGILAQRIVEADWKAEKRADATLANLFMLPPHLLHRCLVACAPLWDSLPEALQLLPLPLHHALVASFAAEGTLEVPITTDGAFLELLSATAVPLPGLLELKLGGNKDVCNLEAACNHRCSPGQGALLARSVAVHTSLTKVLLSDLVFDPPALQTFAACLPRGATPRLAQLFIIVADHPSSSAPVVDCLKRLCKLTRLEVNTDNNQLPQTEAVADTPVQAASLRSAVMPVHLPSLRALVIDAEVEAEEKEADGEGSEVAPSDRSNFILSLLPFICAPSLTLLEFGTYSRNISFSHFRAALARFPSLRELSMNAEMLNRSSCLPLPVHSAVLPVLTSVNLHSMCPVSLPQLVTLSAQLAPNMTKLALSIKVTTAFAKRASLEDVKDARASMLSALRQCTHLRHLKMYTLCSDLHTGEDVLNHTAELAAALKPLTNLTYLHLVARPGLPGSSQRCSLRGSVLADALTALTALQALRICSGTPAGAVLHLQEHQHVLEACAGLAKLSWLDLCFHSRRDVQLPELIPKLRALQKLHVGGSLCGSAVDAQHLQPRWPGVTVDQCCCRE